MCGKDNDKYTLSLFLVLIGIALQVFILPLTKAMAIPSVGSIILIALLYINKEDLKTTFILSLLLTFILAVIYNGGDYGIRAIYSIFDGVIVIFPFYILCHKIKYKDTVLIKSVLAALCEGLGSLVFIFCIVPIGAMFGLNANVSEPLNWLLHTGLVGIVSTFLTSLIFFKFFK